MPSLAANCLSFPSKPFQHIMPSFTRSPSIDSQSSEDNKHKSLATKRQSVSASNPVPNSPLMFDPIRFKTEMCRHYTELGLCRFGHKCLYAHFETEKRLATYKHKKYKTQLCRPFHEDGYCDFGSRCAFIHTKPDINEILKTFETINTMKRFEDIVVSYQCIPRPEDNTRSSLPVFKSLRNLNQN